MSSFDFPRDPTEIPWEPVHVTSSTVTKFEPGLNATQSSLFVTEMLDTVTKVDSPISKPSVFLGSLSDLETASRVKSENATLVAPPLTDTKTLGGFFWRRVETSMFCPPVM